jgi:hypothetical protein
MLCSEDPIRPCKSPYIPEVLQNLFLALRPAALSRPSLLVQVVLHSNERLHDSL